MKVFHAPDVNWQDNILEDPFLLPGAYMVIDGNKMLYHAPDGSETWFTKEVLEKAISCFAHETEEI